MAAMQNNTSAGVLERNAKCSPTVTTSKRANSPVASSGNHARKPAVADNPTAGAIVGTQVASNDQSTAVFIGTARHITAPLPHRSTC